MQFKHPIKNIRDILNSSLPTYEYERLKVMLKVGTAILYMATPVLVNAALNGPPRDKNYDLAYTQMVELADTDGNGVLELGEQLHAWGEMGLHVDVHRDDTQLGFPRPTLGQLEEAIRHYKTIQHH